MDDREPRQWWHGEAIPEDVMAVHHTPSPQHDGCGTECAWIRRPSDWKGPYGYALDESEMLRLMGPVVEVSRG